LIRWKKKERYGGSIRNTKEKRKVLHITRDSPLKGEYRVTKNSNHTNRHNAPQKKAIEGKGEGVFLRKNQWRGLKKGGSSLDAKKTVFLPDEDGWFS